MKLNKIIFFGVGAIGSNLLLNLSHILKDVSFEAYDFDKVEERNIPTQAYLLPHISLPKVSAMQIILGMNHRTIKYTAHNKRIESSKEIEIIINQPGVLGIDCFDNQESRKLLEGFNNIIHIGFNPQYVAEILWGDNYSSPMNLKKEDNDICELSEAVPFINFVVSLASFTIKEYNDSNIKSEYIITNKNNIKKIR